MTVNGKRSIQLEKDIVDFVNRYKEEHGYPPTIRDICKGVGRSSTSTIYYHVSVLKERGELDFGSKKARTTHSTMTNSITDKDHHRVSDDEIVRAVERFIENNGYSPSMREIGNMVGLRSSSSVHKKVTRLCIEGKLNKDDFLTRTITVNAEE